MQSDILATTKLVAERKQKLEAQKGGKTFNAQLIITAQTELESAEDGLKRLKDLQAELFPEQEKVS